MNKIKVLHLINTLKPGGAEANLVNLVKAADKARFEIHVGYSFGGPLEETLAREGVALYKFAGKEHKVKSFASFLIVKRLASYISKNKINIVHTHSFNTHVWGSLAARLGGAKVVEHVHDPRYEEESYLLSRGALKTRQFDWAKRFAKLSDTIVVLTQRNREYLLRHSICADSKIKVLLNGIFLDQGTARTSALEKFSIPAEKKVVLTALRLSKEKNAAFIIDIVSKLNERHKDCVFVIAGDGPERKELEEKVRKNGWVDKILFTGYQPDVRGLLGSSDIFILPTFRELHSIAMIEAMSAGVPVLVSKGAGCNDDFIRHGMNGYLLDPRNPEEWTRTIGTLLDNPDLAKKVGKAGRELVERECDIRKTIKNIEKVYETVIANVVRRRRTW